MIPTWVFDTNVLVAAFLSSSGPPRFLLNAIIKEDIQLALDERIQAEYEDVLLRKKFGFEPRYIYAFLTNINHKKITVLSSLVMHLPDSDDIPFLEVAALLDDPVLVTGNAKHFPLSMVGNVEVLSPRAAWERFLAQA